MFCGIDIGGTNIKYGILDSKNQLIFKDSIPTKNDSTDSIITQVIDIINYFKSNFPNYESIGIGVPGVVDNQNIIKIAPNLNGFINLPFKAILENRTQTSIAIDNDANIAAFAELKIGNGTNLNDFIFVTLGTGIGGAIIIDGKLFKGSNGGAGEIGHIIINSFDSLQNELPEYRHGVLEEYTGRQQIINFAKSELIKNPNSELMKLENFDVKDISNFADMGDELSIIILKKTGEYLGIGLTSIMNLLDINNVIIGGGISLANDILFENFYQTIKHRALPSISNNFKLIKAQFTADAGLMGACLYGKYLLKF